MTPEEVDRVFETFRRSAFRLETLSCYSVGNEDEQVRRFIAGEPPPPVSPEKQEWLDLIRSHVTAGKTMRRVHLIRGPLTDYLRWEIEGGYPPNVAAGEDIRILHVGKGDLPELGETDYWLFDDQLALLMQYDAEGHWLASEPTTDSAVIDECQRKRDLALALAVPLDEYRRRAKAS